MLRGDLGLSGFSDPQLFALKEKERDLSVMPPVGDAFVRRSRSGLVIRARATRA